MKRSIQFLWLLFFIACLFPAGLNGQTAKDVDDDVAGVQPDTAPVKMDGKTLFYVSGVSSYPAGLRAETISKRIKKVAENPSIIADSVIVSSEGDHYRIYVGPEFILNIYSNDAKAEGINIDLLSQLITNKIRDAIIIYRHDRTSEVLVRKILFALGASGLFVICLVLLSWITKGMNRIMTTRLKSSVDRLENKSQRLISSVQMWKILDIVFKAIKWLITVLLSVVFAGYVLGLFPWTNSFAVSAFKVFIKPIADIGRAIINYMPKLVFLIVIILLTRYLLKLVRMLFNGIDKGAIIVHNFYPDWAMPTFKILRTAIIAFSIILAFPYIPGSGSDAFKGVTVFIGVIFSLGSSSFISNIIAGYTMTYRRAFKKGDLIEVDKNTGFVEEQNLLVTRIRSCKNEEIIIPNSVLLNSNIINFNARADQKGLIIHTVVGIGYETPWRQVDSMLKLAANRTEGVLKEPPPFVLKRSLGDFAVNYEINVHINDTENILKHYNSLHQNILDVFNENNVQIMTPAYMGDPATPKVVPKDQWDAPVIQ